MPWDAEESEQEQAQRPLCHCHSNHSKSLANSLEQDCFGDVPWVEHLVALAESIMGCDGYKRAVTNQADLGRLCGQWISKEDPRTGISTTQTESLI